MVGVAPRTSENVYILNTRVKEECHLNLTDDSWLWHRRLGHINFDNLVKISKLGVVRNLPKIIKPSNPICKHCQLGKQTRVSFKTKEHSSSKPLELVHIDLCGPTRTKSLQGESYFMLFVDDFTRMCWVFFSRKNQRLFKNLKPSKSWLKMR